MAGIDLAETVNRAIAGDRRAFDRLVQHYQVRISRYLLRLVHDEELALDLTQDTFVRAYRSLQTLRAAEHAGAWLYRIATNVAIQARGRSTRMQCQPWPECEGEELGQTESPDRQVIDRDTVAEALRRLPHDRLVCLLLHVNEGFSYEEVAAIVNSTPEAVRKRVARAKQQFRELYIATCEENVHYAVR